MYKGQHRARPASVRYLTFKAFFKDEVVTFQRTTLQKEKESEDASFDTSTSFEDASLTQQFLTNKHCVNEVYMTFVTYPWPLNHYCGLSVLAKCFLDIVHYASIIVPRSKRINNRSWVLAKSILST